MPRLWTDTIETHRREVREAIVNTTMSLVEEHGLLSVTMSQIAEAAGVGRATLYKYFPDVEAILETWHDGQINHHLAALAEVRDRRRAPWERLAGVLEAFALISHEARSHRDTELAALLHGHGRVRAAEDELRHMLRELLADAAASGDIRDDIGSNELATYCLHALTAAAALPSKSAVRRLVQVTLAGLRGDG